MSVIISMLLFVTLNHVLCKKFIDKNVNSFDISNKKVLLFILIQLAVFVLLGAILLKVVFFAFYMVAIGLTLLSSRSKK